MQLFLTLTHKLDLNLTFDVPVNLLILYYMIFIATWFKIYLQWSATSCFCCYSASAGRCNLLHITSLINVYWNVFVLRVEQMITWRSTRSKYSFNSIQLLLLLNEELDLGATMLLVVFCVILNGDYSYKLTATVPVH